MLTLKAPLPPQQRSLQTHTTSPSNSRLFCMCFTPLERQTDLPLLSTKLVSTSYLHVPGAGDDEESWACGLTPALMWQHAQCHASGFL
eukprot:scaffold20272_cov19-Tisochrysis_lutea.AAC.1